MKKNREAERRKTNRRICNNRANEQRVSDRRKYKVKVICNGDPKNDQICWGCKRPKKPDLFQSTYYKARCKSCRKERRDAIEELRRQRRKWAQGVN